MKKVLLSIIMICASVMSFAQIPDFTVDGAQNPVFFDSKSVKGKGSDYIQVINFSDDSDAIFAIYGYNKKEGWIFIGDSTIQSYGDSGILETEYDHKLKKFSYFAVVPKNGKKYKVEFSKFVINMYVVKHNCISFRIIPEIARPSEKASVMKNEDVKGSFKDNVKVENFTGHPISVKVYGSNDGENWQIVAGGTIKDEGASLEHVVESETSKYVYYAAETTDSKIYDMKFSKKHNDLYISVK